MKIKKRLKNALAIALGLLILDLFCFWYYNPAAYERDESRATDLIREPGAFTSRAKEGAAWAKIDENGYNNASVPGDEDVFVLMMGTSHTEGLNVLQDETASARLEARLRDAGYAGRVYNIGISSHTLTRNAFNFERALERFAPTGYAVIETQSVLFYTTAIQSVLDGDVERLPLDGDGLPDLLSDRPLLRALYRQFMSLAGMGDAENEAHADAEIPENALALYEDTLTELFTRMTDAAAARGVKLVLLYHPHLLLQEDGTVVPDTNAQCLTAFGNACEKSGALFLDMTEPFLAAYEKDYTLPHGFDNTAAGAGHLNRDGQAMIAEELFRLIEEQEARK